MSSYFSQTLTIYGLITSNETGESLIGANVFIESTNYGSYTDKNGFYSITFDSSIQNKTIVVQYLGFNSIKKSLVINDNDIKLKLDFELDRSYIDLDEVNVTGEK